MSKPGVSGRHVVGKNRGRFSFFEKEKRPNFFQLPIPNLQHLLLAFSSAALLVISFPNFNQIWCAWVALVPWLVMLRSCTPRAAFRLSYIIGFIFFLSSM